MVLLSLVLSLPPQGPDVGALLRAAPEMAPFREVLEDARGHRLQVLLAEPVREGDRVVLRRSHLGDAQQYFYPASAIKLCGAVAALLELNAYNAAHGTAFGLDTELAIEPRFPGDARIEGDASNLDGGALTMRHMLRKLFLVSDNQAYNHCVEIAGTDGLNRAMWDAGFTSARLWHRLSEQRTLEENRQTRGVLLRQGGAEGAFPARAAPIDLSNEGFAELDVGSAWLRGGERVEGPMSFAQKNAISLVDLQDVLVEVVRPEIDTGKPGFPGLSIEQRAFVVGALGELPRESRNPAFDPAKVPDHHCKFVLPGVRAVLPAGRARVYDKIGRAYGFSIENAYVEDLRTGAGFFLAVVIYTNPDGTLNDDEYAYEALADPFLAAVGAVMTRAVLGSR